MKMRRTLFFEPKEDITAYELALIVRLLTQMLSGGAVSDEMFDRLPKATARHYRIIDEK